MFEIFNVGFLSVTFADVIDIVLVAIIFYKVYEKKRYVRYNLKKIHKLYYKVKI